MDNEKIKKEVDKKIDTLVDQGITSTTTIDALDKLIDIKKDMLEIEKMEGHKYRGEYGEYGNYGRNYMEGGYQEGNYGRRMRDSRGRFRGHEMIDEMDREYGNYSEGREQYGAEGQTMKALESMMEAVVDFVKMLKQDASSQKEMQLIEKYIKKLENV